MERRKGLLIGAMTLVKKTNYGLASIELSVVKPINSSDLPPKGR
jgi:hypothetical protein